MIVDVNRMLMAELLYEEYNRTVECGGEQDYLDAIIAELGKLKIPYKFNQQKSLNGEEIQFIQIDHGNGNFY